MSVQYEVTAITGKYTDREGKEKNRYTKLGVVLQTRNGLMLKVEAVPIGWDGWAYLNEPRTDDGKQDKPKPSRSAPREPDGFEDETVPF